MSLPLITVVIPTFKRPEFLPRAVRSVLACMGCEIEIIVVPNGLDNSWRQSMTPFLNNARVRIEPIELGNVNEARNHGLILACGKYVRFLDDDDYLLPDAIEQIYTLESSSAEVCSGRVKSVDQEGNNHGLLSFPDTKDFVCAAASYSGFRLLTGNVFLSSLLSQCRWDPGVDKAEDYAWMIDLAAHREWCWIHLNKTVGVWFQHNQRRRGLRASTMAPMDGREEVIISRLISLHEHLTQSGRINLERKTAISSALWHYAHRGFPYRPLYWRKIAQKAVNISPGSRPDVSAYRHGLLRWFPPVGTECVFVPIRRLTRLYRDIWRALHSREYIRKL